MFVFRVCAGQITSQESLFTYPPGLGPSDFSNPSHVPVFSDQLNISAEARAACGGSQACLFDATATNDINVGVQTMMTETMLLTQESQAGEPLVKIKKCVRVGRNPPSPPPPPPPAMGEGEFTLEIPGYVFWLSLLKLN